MKPISEKAAFALLQKRRPDIRKYKTFRLFCDGNSIYTVFTTEKDGIYYTRINAEYKEG